MVKDECVKSNLDVLLQDADSVFEIEEVSKRIKSS